MDKKNKAIELLNEIQSPCRCFFINFINARREIRMGAIAD
jgi:hypothetical protein